MVYTIQVAHDAAIMISDEHTAYEWVDYAEAAVRLAYKYPPEFTAALQGAGAPVV